MLFLHFSLYASSAHLSTFAAVPTASKCKNDVLLLQLVRMMSNPLLVAFSPSLPDSFDSFDKRDVV
jgi:hypothetical protein